MPQIYGDKVEGLKGLYQFRMLLKSKVVAYKEAIGAEPDPSLLKQIRWVCMDVASKQLASQSGLDHKTQRFVRTSTGGTASSMTAWTSLKPQRVTTRWA